MTTLGNLVVEVSANVARFQSDMGRMAQIAENSSAAIQRTMKAASSAMSLLIGVGSVGAFAAMIEGSIQAKARLYDLSLQSGISVEALGALGKVARYSGTDLADVVANANRLTKSLATSTEESKGAAVAMKALGLNFEQFKNLSPDQQLLAIAKSLEQFNDGAGKSAAAMLLFGKSGTQMLPFLKELAERNGLVSKQTTAAAMAAKEYEDNIIAIRSAGDEWKNQMVNDILPALVKITNELVDGRKAYGGWISAILNIGLKVDPFKSVGENLNDARADLEKWQKSLDDAKASQAAGGLGAAIFSGRDAERVRIAQSAIDELTKRMSYLKAQQAREALALGAGVTDRFSAKRTLTIAPPAEKGGTAADPGKGFLESLARQVEQIDRGRFEMLRLEAAQKGVSAAAEVYIRKLQDASIKAEALKQIEERTRAIEEERGRIGEFFSQGSGIAKGVQETTEALTRNVVQQRRATELRRLDELTIKAIGAASQEAVPEIIKLADAMRAKLIDALDELDKKERDMAANADLGIQRALDSYAQAAQDKAKFAENFVTGSLSRMEDALVNFVKTGKLSFSDLFGFMAEEFLRQQIRMAVAGMDWGGGLGGIVKGIGAALGFTSHATGLQRVPYDGYPAMLHQGERVLTRSEADRAGGGMLDASVSIGSVGDGVSRGQMVAAINQAQARQMAQIQRLLRQDKLR